MGILIISPFFGPNIGGVETHLHDLCEYLRKRDYRVYVFTYQPLTTKARGLQIEERDNLEIRRFSWFGYNWFPVLEKNPFLQFLYLASGLLFYSFFYLSRYHKKIDVVHAQGLSAAFVGLVISRFFRKRFIISTHTVYRLKERPLLSFVTKRILKYADMILALGEGGRVDLVSIGLKEERVRRYYYSVNQDIFKALDKKLCREKLELPLDSFIALFVGRFVPQKGLKTLTEAIKLAKPGILFLFIGEGPDEKYIRGVSASFKNAVLCGGIDNDKLVYYYSAADVFSWGSVDGDIIGRVCIESLLCGLPIIAPNSLELFGVKKDVSPSALPEGVGFLIEPESSKLAEKLNFLSENRQILERIRPNCRKFAEENYGLKNFELITKSYEKE